MAGGQGGSCGVGEVQLRPGDRPPGQRALPAPHKACLPTKPPAPAAARLECQDGAAVAHQRRQVRRLVAGRSAAVHHRPAGLRRQRVRRHARRLALQHQRARGHQWVVVQVGAGREAQQVGQQPVPLCQLALRRAGRQVLQMQMSGSSGPDSCRQEQQHAAASPGRHTTAARPGTALTTAAHLRRCSGGGSCSQASASSTPIFRVLTRAVRGCGVSGPGCGSSSAALAAPAPSSSCCSAPWRSACRAPGRRGVDGRNQLKRVQASRRSAASGASISRPCRPNLHACLPC